MNRLTRSDVELSKALDHLHDETEMLRETAERLARKDTDQITSNALIEAYTIHARALVEFLYVDNPRKRDDVIAGDFLDNPSKWASSRLPKSERLENTPASR